MNDRPKSRAWIGILLVCGTTLCFGVLDTVAKYLTREYHPLQVVWGRYFFQVVVILPFIYRRGLRRSFATNRPGLQIGRAVLISLITFMFFTTLRYLPLVDAQAISFTMPLILTAIAFFFFGEKVGPRRWAAVTVGFVGVLLVIRPTGDSMHWAALLCLACAALNACFHLMTRALASSDSPDIGIAISGVVGAAIFSATVPFVWRTPDMAAWLLLASMGAFGTMGHYCLSRAYIYARASVIAPYVYVQMVWVALFGFALFGDVPSPATLAGTAVVVAAGIYVFYRERKLKGDG
ncbi:MAG: DMT family transporter [Proteobacteria bacterium]|nr:DMT family transporter [Pseudomonadota bacterium]